MVALLANCRCLSNNDTYSCTVLRTHARSLMRSQPSLEGPEYPFDDIVLDLLQQPATISCSVRALCLTRLVQYLRR